MCRGSQNKTWKLAEERHGAATALQGTALREDGLIGSQRLNEADTHTHIHTLVHMHTHDNLTTSMALPRHPSAHGNRAAGTQGDRNDISEAFQLIRPVPLTLSESTMTNIYRMGGGGTRAREGPTGQGLVAMAKDRPGKLPTGSRRQDIIAATAALSPWALRPQSLPQGLSDGGAGVVAVNALGPQVDRGGRALTRDTGLGEGIEKAWTASQRHPLACVEMCLVLPSTQGIECWSLSLWSPESQLYLHKGQHTCGPEACSSHLHKGVMVQMCPVHTLGGGEWQMSEMSNSESLNRKEIC